MLQATTLRYHLTFDIMTIGLQCPHLGCKHLYGSFYIKVSCTDHAPVIDLFWSRHLNLMDVEKETNIKTVCGLYFRVILWW